jgi:hypothetical protein
MWLRFASSGRAEVRCASGARKGSPTAACKKEEKGFYGGTPYPGKGLRPLHSCSGANILSLLSLFYFLIWGQPEKGIVIENVAKATSLVLEDNIWPLLYLTGTFHEG